VVVLVCYYRFLYVAVFGDEEIRVYSIQDDKKLALNSVSVSICSTNYGHPAAVLTEPAIMFCCGPLDLSSFLFFAA